MGSGYTVEGQKTSEEKYGGLQIEIIPELKQRLRDWIRPLPESTKLETMDELKLSKMCVNEFRTPKQEELKVGDVMHSFVNPVIRPEWVLVRDLTDGEGDGNFTVSFLGTI